MAEVKATTSRTVDGEPGEVFANLADYVTHRPAILPEQYSEYEVREGGKGAGTVVHWKLQATSKRSRDVLATVTEPAEHTLVETDANSSMVTTWKALPGGPGKTTVTVTTVWQGAGGIGGFFEKTFAPGGLKKIYDAALAKI
jgi:hypothetical protein